MISVPVIKRLVMIRGQMRCQLYILTFLSISAIIFLIMSHGTSEYLLAKGKKTVSSENQTLWMKHLNLPGDLKVQPRLTAAGFSHMWKKMRADFVTSFQTLLSDGATSTDPRLTRLIQSYMFQPSNTPYKMSYNFGPSDQYKITKDYFHEKGKTLGFFVECGGLDGERSSTTYHLERDGWQGLLIEADPDYFLQSLGKNRRAWKLNAALCPSAEPSIIRFKDKGNSGQGAIADQGNIQVPCIPLALVLKALNRTSIDFLSLDVEGVEMKILRTFPFKDVDVEAINLEYIHNAEKPASFTKFMASVGYSLLKKIDVEKADKALYTRDLYYVKNAGQ